MEYKTIIAGDLLDLENNINNHLKEGWELYGNLIYHGNLVYHRGSEMIYLQAMTREVSKDVGFKS